MNLKSILPLSLIPFAFACGSSSGEESTEQAATVAAQTASALSATTPLSAEAANAQVDQPSGGGGDGGGGGRDLVAPETAPCGMVRFENGAVIVDYGTGCMAGGHMLSGSYSIRLSLTGGLNVVLGIDDFGVDTKVFHGDAAAMIAKGRVASNMDLQMTENAVTQSIAFDGTIEATKTTIDFEGAGSYSDGTLSASYDATGIHQVRGDCYPNAGTIAIKTPLIKEALVTFTTSTPTTGQVTVKIGPATTTYQLPIGADCAK